MRRFTLTIITLLTITLQAIAADLSFSYENFTLKGNTLQYRKAVIEGAEAKPLLVLCCTEGRAKVQTTRSSLPKWALTPYAIISSATITAPSSSLRNVLQTNRGAA